MSRMHFRNREGAERALLNRDETPDAVSGLLTLAELYGTVSIPHWRDDDDAWGAHWSLSVSCTDETREWIIVTERQVYY